MRRPCRPTNTALSVSSSPFHLFLSLFLVFLSLFLSPSLSLSFLSLPVSLVLFLLISSHSHPPISLSICIHLYLCHHFFYSILSHSVSVPLSAFFSLALSCRHLSVSLCLCLPHYPHLQVQPSRTTDGVPQGPSNTGLADPIGLGAAPAPQYGQHYWRA